MLQTPQKIRSSSTNARTSVGPSDREALHLDTTHGILYNEISNGHIAGLERLPHVVFPDNVLPISVDDARTYLNADYVNSKWSAFPTLLAHVPKKAADGTRETTNEQAVCTFLNHLVDVIRAGWRAAHPTDPELPYRKWHATPDRALPMGVDGFPQYNRKSDAFGADSTVNEDAITRRDIQHYLEIKYGADGAGKENTFYQLAENTRLSWCAQDSRLFFLGISFVNKHHLRLLFFDRSGALSSQFIDIHKQPDVFLRIILGLAFAPAASLGANPMFHPGPNGTRRVTLDGEEYQINEVLHSDTIIRGRATVVYNVTHIRSGKPYILKISWVDMSRTDLEGPLLKEMSDVPYLAHLAHLVDENDISIEKDAYGDATYNGAVLTTLGIRERLGLQPGGANHKSVHDTIELRRLSWVLLGDIGEGLEKFRSLRELVTIFRDTITAHKSLSETKGTLHRDISFRNLMINTEKALHDPKIREGLLIDLDYAKRGLGQDTTTAKAHRTGTLAFISCQVLMGMKHRDVHDLESFFYVLLWACTVLAGPNETWRGNHFRIDRCRIFQWIAAGTFAKIGTRKFEQMSGVVSFGNLLDQIHPYFRPLGMLLHDLRALVFKRRLELASDALPSWLTANQPAANALEQFTHDDMIALFDKCLADLPEHDPQMPPDGWHDDLADIPEPEDPVVGAVHAREAETDNRGGSIKKPRTCDP